MKARALSTFITVCLFIVANLVSTLGVFVPSAAASDDLPPVVPALVSPVDGSAVDTTEPTLEWTYESEVASYTVQVATDTSPLIDEVVEGATSYLVPSDADLEVGVTYYWRVAVTPEDDELPSWSATSSFTVEDTEELPDMPDAPDVPGMPSLLGPLDEALVSYGDIKNNLESAWLKFASEEGVQTSHIKISGEFLKDGMVTSLDLDMIISGDSFSMVKLASDDSEFPQLIAGDTYTWAVRSSFVEDASKDSEEVWGEWSDNWTFTVVAKEPENDEPIDEGDTDEEDIAPKATTTTTTTTTTRIEHVVTVVTSSYTYPNPQLVYEGSGATLGDSAPVDRSISSTSTENIIENEDRSEPVEGSGAFLLLGWWWIVVVATVAGGYYLFFRVPTE